MYPNQLLQLDRKTKLTDIWRLQYLDRVSCSEILNKWKVNIEIYPKMAVLARKFLPVPATSAASESAFRYGVLIETELRNRLKPDTLFDLLFVRHLQEIWFCHLDENFVFEQFRKFETFWRKTCGIWCDYVCFQGINDFLCWNKKLFVSMQKEWEFRVNLG